MSGRSCKKDLRRGIFSALTRSWLIREWFAEFLNLINLL